MPGSSPPCSDLTAYLVAVNEHVRALLDAAPLCPEQIHVLRAATSVDVTPANPLRHIVSPFYLLLRAVGAEPNEAAVRLGAMLLLTQRGLHLIDDVQDGEVPASFAGDGMLAINAGLSLFFLAIDELRAAEALMPLGGTRPSPWGSLLRHALRSCRAQHIDLCGRNRPRSAEEAITLATERYALACVLAETAGMCVADREETRDAYTSIGDALACIHQLIDDVSDLFGAAPSADLRTGTWTAPIAFVYESLTADERVQWVARLEERSAATQVEVCRRAYETGAMHRVATVLARERERFLGALGTVATNSPYAAMLMAWLDDLVGLVHRPCRAPERLDILAVEATDLAPADLEIYQRLREARTQTLARISDSVQA